MAAISPPRPLGGRHACSSRPLSPPLFFPAAPPLDLTCHLIPVPIGKPLICSIFAAISRAPFLNDSSSPPSSAPAMPKPIRPASSSLISQPIFLSQAFVNSRSSFSRARVSAVSGVVHRSVVIVLSLRSLVSRSSVSTTQ